MTRSARSAEVSPGRKDMSVSGTPGLTALIRMFSPMWLWGCDPGQHGEGGLRGGVGRHPGPTVVRAAGTG